MPIEGVKTKHVSFHLLSWKKALFWWKLPPCHIHRLNSKFIHFFPPSITPWYTWALLLLPLPTLPSQWLHFNRRYNPDCSEYSGLNSTKSESDLSKRYSSDYDYISNLHWLSLETKNKEFPTCNDIIYNEALLLILRIILLPQ